MAVRDRITDTEWSLLAPLMNAGAGGGGAPEDLRPVVEAVLERLRTGCPWHELGGTTAEGEAAAGWYRRWSADGTWQRIADRLRIDPATGRSLVDRPQVEAACAVRPAPVSVWMGSRCALRRTHRPHGGGTR
ncbi:transposase [Nocardiopsis sp. RSe5-2]|uniref:Transposase n=1 Tax=Nocardiopsis endophytica TaxID=3018445 RepID=A0ABT4UAJ3_9ACTN|nr:transposase [Nocardiopsis endophytica]MDA2813945.1 transposase [Nocardiopsis endophytica]